MKPYPLLLILVLAAETLSAQNRFDVIISEIMADPSPAVGLPNNEWMELKNISAIPINLHNWRIADASGQSGPMPAYTLMPDSFVIICGTGSLASMSNFGPAISVSSFPSLDNESDLLVLKSSSGLSVHAINYTVAWYQNDLKKEGGWTLEMIDPHNPCGGIANWKASSDPAGGTPGKKNSVDDINRDNKAPRLQRTYTLDPYNIIAVFDESLDSAVASNINRYTLRENVVFGATPVAPLFNSVRLSLIQPLQSQTTYELTVSDLADCSGNILSGSTCKAGLPGDLNFSEMVINEILFNPKSGGEDYVELLNRSNKIFDASKISIANRNSSNAISNVRQLATTPYLIFPGDHIVATPNEIILARDYRVMNPGNTFVVNLPSMPDDRGVVILLNQQGIIVDELNYNKDWHFKLLANAEGVALERIDPNGATQDPSNWHSAASTVGYGTPTYQNSQYKNPGNAGSAIEVHPKTFSPDNDGQDDIATIKYQTPEPGYVASVMIFDAAGRMVRTLVSNNIMAREGYWNWDGLGEKGNRLPVGIYIIFTRIFNLQGKVLNYKTPVVLARHLN